MYCNNCGNKLEDEAVFCTKCGVKAETVQKNEEKKVSKCCVCGSDNLMDNATVFFMGERGDCKELCEKCDEQMGLLEKNHSEAIKYFKNICAYITDREVKENIIEILSEKENRGENEKGYSQADTTIWVKGLKGVAWFQFFAIIILGLVLAILSDEGIGFLIFLVSIPIAFLTVAGIMIFLDIADDIRKIKKELIKRK